VRQEEELNDVEAEILALSARNPLSGRLTEIRNLGEGKEARRDPLIAYRYSYNDVIDRFKGRGQRAVERLAQQGLVEKHKWSVSTGRRRSFLYTICATEIGRELALEYSTRLSDSVSAGLEQAEQEQAITYLRETFGIEADDADSWRHAIERAKFLDEHLLDSRAARRPSENYSLVIRGALKDDRAVTVAEYERLANAMRIEGQAIRAAPKPDIIFEMADDLSRLTIRREAKPVLTISRPPLLWPCPCKVPRFFGDGKRECPIHDSPDGAAIEAAFAHGWVEIVFRNVKILWRNDSGVWPPSIDSFHLVNTLIATGAIAARDSGKVLDMGAGTGFIGIALRKSGLGVSHVTYSDWLFNTFWSTRLNVARNHEEQAATVRIANGFHPEGSPIHRHDVVVCNPPYLPVEQHPRLAVHHSVAGTALLEEVAREGGNVAARGLVGCSELALPDLNRAAESSGTAVRQLGTWRKVPFRVAHFLDDHDYLQWLIEERGLLHEADGAFPLLHRIGVFELTYRLNE
jgi:hypothetical protein